jgi:hypothetical protein
LAFLGVLQQLEAEIRSGGVEQHLADLHVGGDRLLHSESMSRSPSCHSLEASLLSKTASIKSTSWYSLAKKQFLPSSFSTGDLASSGNHTFVDPI